MQHRDGYFGASLHWHHMQYLMRERWRWPRFVSVVLIALAPWQYHDFVIIPKFKPEFGLDTAGKVIPRVICYGNAARA